MKKILSIAAFFIACVFAPAFAQQVPQSAAQLRLSFAPVVKKAAPAVVNIYTKRVVKERVNLSPFANDPLFRQFFGNTPMVPGGTRERVEGSLGSGVIVQADGTVVTSHHVIKDATEIRVVLSDRREFEAEVVKRDAQTDLAVLRIKGAPRLPYLEMRDTDTLEVGDIALAIGNPFGVGQTVTQGIISALARATSSVADYQFFIQTDAAINPGNSGGALVDVDGRLIGINTAIFSTTGAAVGIGFAIPADMVKAVLGSQTQEGRIVRPWLGVATQDVTPEMAQSLGMEAPSGVIVRKVTPGSPAEKAGVQEGDVITHAGNGVIADQRALQYRIGTQQPGTPLALSLLRGGQGIKTEAVLATAPRQKSDAKRLQGSHPLNGFQVATLTPSLAEELGLQEMSEQAGVALLSGGAIGGIGLAKGDIIIQVNGQAITTVAQLEKALTASKRGWAIAIKRGDQVMTLTIR